MGGKSKDAARSLLTDRPKKGSAQYAKALAAHASPIARGAGCEGCPLFGSRRGPVDSQTRRSKLTVIVDAPDADAVFEEEPLVGRVGRFVGSALHDVEWSRQDVATVQIIECQPPHGWGLDKYEKRIRRWNRPLEAEHKARVKAWKKQGGPKSGTEEPRRSSKRLNLPSECCARRFRHDLRKVRPLVVVPFGSRALESVGAAIKVPVGGKKVFAGELRIATIDGQRGHPFIVPAKHAKYIRAQKLVILPTFHPGMTFSGQRHMAHRVAEDLARAAEIADRGGRLLYKIPEIKMEPTEAQALRWLKAAKESGWPITVDIETGPRPGREADDGLHIDGLIRCVNLTYGPDNKEETMVIPFFRKNRSRYWPSWKSFRRVREALRDVLDSCPLIFHNGYAFDIPRLVRRRFMTEKDRTDLFDTILIHHATREQSNPHGLGYLMSCFFDAPLHKGDVDHKAAGGAQADRELWKYGGQDTIGAQRCARKLAKWVAIDGTAHTVKDDHDIGFNIIARMNARPLLVDAKLRDEASQLLREKAEGFKRELQAIVGPDFNPASPQQVGRYLYETRGLEPAVNTEGREFDEGKDDSASTSVLALMALEDSGGLGDVETAMIDKQIRFKTADKLRQMIDSVEGNTSEFGAEFLEMWITWKLHVTPSQRLASSPNAQNLPKLGEFNMRRLFRAPPGYKWVGADKEQIEARISAMVIGDEVALKAFRAGLDIHAVNAATLFAKTTKQEQEIYDEIAHKRGEYKKNKELIKQVKDDLKAEQLMLERRYNGKIPTHVAQNLKDAWAEKLKWVQGLIDGNDWAELVRRVAKYFIYLETYGGEEDKLGQTLRVQRDKSTGERLFTDEKLGRKIEDACAEWHKVLHERRPWIKRWQRSVTEKVWAEGRNRDIIQLRWRFYPNGPSKKNAPMNHEIQTAATGIVRDEMRELVQVIGWGHGERGRYWGRHAGFKHHGHDSLGFWVKESRAEEFAEKHINRVMNRTISYNGIDMPFPAEAAISDTLGEQ